MCAHTVEHPRLLKRVQLCLTCAYIHTYMTKLAQGHHVAVLNVSFALRPCEQPVDPKTCASVHAHIHKIESVWEMCWNRKVTCIHVIKHSTPLNVPDLMSM